MTIINASTAVALTCNCNRDLKKTQALSRIQTHNLCNSALLSVDTVRDKYKFVVNSTVSTVYISRRSTSRKGVGRSDWFHNSLINIMDTVHIPRRYKLITQGTDRINYNYDDHCEFKHFNLYVTLHVLIVTSNIPVTTIT